MREIIFARIVNSTIQPLDATGVLRIQPVKKIVAQKLQVNHFNSFCNTYNSKIGVRENPNLPFNQFNNCLRHTYFFKSSIWTSQLAEQATQFNQGLQHTYFKNGVCNTYILENGLQQENILLLESTTLETNTQFFWGR